MKKEEEKKCIQGELHERKRESSQDEPLEEKAEEIAVRVVSVCESNQKKKKLFSLAIRYTQEG